MTELLIISLVFLLGLSFFLLKGNLASPTLQFILGFFFCTVIAYQYRAEWKLDLSPTTFFVVFGACFSYLLVEYCVFKRMSRKSFQQKRFSDAVPTVSVCKLIILLFFQIIVFILYAKAKMAFTGSSSLIDALADINEQVKFQGKVFTLPSHLAIMVSIANKLPYVFCVLIPFYHNKMIFPKIKILLLLNFLVGLFGSLLSGGRMHMCALIIAFISFSYLQKKISLGWHTKLPNKKFIILGGLALLIFAFAFSSLGQLVGRKTEDAASYVFAIYCGAELKNLDNYIQHPFEFNSQHFAQNTLKGIYSEIYPKESSQYDILNFESAGKFALGNVKTALYPMLLDFGNAFFLCVMVEALLLCLLMKKAFKTSFWFNGKLNIWVILLAYMYGSAFCSFFSEQFFSRFTVKWLISAIAYWSIITFFLQKQFGLNIIIGKHYDK